MSEVAVNLGIVRSLAVAVVRGSGAVLRTTLHHRGHQPLYPRDLLPVLPAGVLGVAQLDRPLPGHALQRVPPCPRFPERRHHDHCNTELLDPAKAIGDEWCGRKGVAVVRPGGRRSPS